ncbi:MAG: hypothetical protein ING19_12895 [Azospirillum sp.]|nr:hypothetical protein [Azospirillum sp.]
MDIFEVRRHRPSKRALIEWGLEHGLCERREIHGFVYADEELGSEVEQIFESASAAAEEAESYGAATFKRRILAATERLTEANGTPPPRQPRDALEELAMLAGRATRAAGIAKIDGFYATEKYDPDAYSSPRGGIFPEAVEDWERERVDFRFVDDEVELDKAATEVRAEKLRIAPVEGANAEFSKKSRFVV